MTLKVAKQRLLNTAWLGTNEDRETTEEAVRVLIKAVEQQPILDKIRAEIEQTAKDYDKFDDYRRVRGLWIALDIIDKYRQEG